jgi:hypothetical protein
MGVQPPFSALPIRQQSDSRLPKPQNSPAKRISRRHRLEQLKDKILESSPSKLSRFSLSHMRRVVIPPVAIPSSMNGSRAVSTVVSGKSVPYTRRMWENRKKKTFHLDMIDEYVQLYR